MICRTEFSVIALIGIILLIGIVEKNAIMMIDFALEAERKEHRPPHEAIFQACLLRFRPIMMTTMAALLGGVPLALGTGTGSELRRPLGIAIVGGLIFSQLLTLYTTPVIYLAFDRLRQAGPARAPPASPADAAACGRRSAHEHLRAVHPAAGRDVAADDRRRAGRRHRLRRAAGVAAAAGGFPDHPGERGLPGASPETMASSVATPLERQFGRIAGITEMTSTSSLGSTQVTLQFDLNRNIDAAARDVQAAINAARGQLPPNLPSNPTYREGQSGRRADPEAGADVGRRRQAADVRPGVVDPAAEDRAGPRRRPGGRRRRRAAGGARRRQSDGAEQLRARPRRRPQAARRAPMPTSRRASSPTASRTWSLATTDQLFKAKDYRPLVLAYSDGAALQLADVGQRRRTRSRTSATPGSPTASRRCC